MVIGIIIGFILGIFLVTKINNYMLKNRQEQRDNQNANADSECVVLPSVALPEQELVISPLSDDCDNL